MILSAKVLLEAEPDPSEAEIRHGIAGNLCRCTGYQYIVKSIQDAAATLAGIGGASTGSPGGDAAAELPRATRPDAADECPGWSSAPSASPRADRARE